MKRINKCMCGNKNTEIEIKYLVNKPVIYYQRVCQCGISGPTEETEELANRQWNKMTKFISKKLRTAASNYG